MSCILCTGFDECGIYRPHNPCQISHEGPCGACVKMKELESQISETRHILERQLQQHQALRTQMNRVHNPTILQVPPEITSTVFQFCFPPLSPPSDNDSDQIIPENYRQDVAARLVLGAVCSGWRRIAWSTPRLWTDIAVRLNSDLSWQLNFIREWLDRSGALPLSISVYRRFYAARSSPDAYANAGALINLLNQYSDRWHVLQLYYVPACFYSCFAGNRESTPILHSLALDGNYGEYTEGRFVMHDARPINVSLCRISFSSVAISWDALTCARLDGLQVEDCLELLRHAPKMETFEVDLIMDDDEDDEFITTQAVPVSMIIYEQLKELNIATYDILPLETFLGSVIFPALEKLTIHDDEMNIPFGPFQSLIERSSCRLRDLTIDGTNYGSSDIVSFLEHVPSLTRLELIPLPYSDHAPHELFKRLADTAMTVHEGVEEEKCTFLPQLRSFVYNADERYSTCDRDFPWNLLPGIFGPLAEVHNPRRRPLRSVEIYFDRYDDPPLVIDKECIPSFLAVLRAGFDLKIQYMRDSLDLLADVHSLLKKEDILLK